MLLPLKYKSFECCTHCTLQGNGDDRMLSKTNLYGNACHRLLKKKRWSPLTPKNVKPPKKLMVPFGEASKATRPI
jgi:hypothetical protein